MPAVKRSYSCAGCRKNKDELAQLKKLFEDTSTKSSDLIAYLKQSPLCVDVIQEFFALPATDNKVVQYVYKTDLMELICTDCSVLVEDYYGPDYIYINAFEASLVNAGELDSQTFKAISMALCRGAKDTLEEFRSNQWCVPDDFAQILNGTGVFNEFASAPEFEEVDRKRLRNALSPLLKFEENWDQNESLSSAAGVAIFDNVKSALAILDKPTRKAKTSKSTSLKVKQKPSTVVVDEFTRIASSKSVDNRTWAAQDKDIPLKWLKVLSKDKSESVRNAIAGNPQTTAEILKMLSRDRSEYVVRSVALNPSTPAVTLKTLASANSEDIRYAVACNEQVPVPILQLLAKDDSVGVRNAVARHEKTPTRLLVALARDKDEDVRQGVAENPKAPAELLEALSLDEAYSIRYYVASNPNTPISILRRLWGDENQSVRGCVAENSSISKKFLLEILDQSQKLKRNRTTFVSAIAGNPKTPVDVLVALSQDKDKWIRSAVAGNPRTPVVVLVALSHDKDKWARRVVAENAKTPQETLRVLARELLPRDEYSGTNVRAAVAGNARCPVDLLESLAKDKSVEIRCCVAGNPSTNAETLMHLAQDNDGSVRANVAANDSVTPEIKALVYSFKIPISD